MNNSIELTKYTFNSIDDAIPHIYAMAIELRKADEITAISFSVTYNLLVSQQGCFYTASINGEIAGYACFSHGCSNPDIRRLYYFAVPEKSQRNGIGSKVLMAIINNEIPSPNGALTVACKPSLSGFYEKLGFSNTGPSEDISSIQNNTIFTPMNPNCERDVVLTYAQNALLDPKVIISQKVFYMCFDLNELTPHLPLMEGRFGIDLTSDLPKPYCIKS